MSLPCLISINEFKNLVQNKIQVLVRRSRGSVNIRPHWPLALLAAPPPAHSWLLLCAFVLWVWRCHPVLPSSTDLSPGDAATSSYFSLNRLTLKQILIFFMEKPSSNRHAQVCTMGLKLGLTVRSSGPEKGRKREDREKMRSLGRGNSERVTQKMRGEFSK